MEKNGKMILNNAEKIVDYSAYIKGINIIKFNYAMEKESLKTFTYYDNYATCKKKYISYITKYKKVMMNVVNRILKLFSGFLKTQKYMVVLNGSFARNSYREFSDVDVFFVLEKKKTKAWATFEELFYYALSCVISVDRERVYNMFDRFVLPLPQENIDNDVEIVWANGKKIKYSVDESFAPVLTASFTNERHYNNLLKSIENRIINDAINQSAYSYQVVFSNTEYNLENDIMAIEFKNRKNFNMPNYAIELSNLKQSYVSRDLKAIVKDLFFNEFLEFSSYIRHYLVRRQNYRKLLDVNEVFNNRYFDNIFGKNKKKLQELYYEYVFYLTRVEMCLNKVDVSLKSSDVMPIDSKQLLDFYKIKFKTRENVLNKLFGIISEIRELYKVILPTL